MATITAKYGSWRFEPVSGGSTASVTSTTTPVSSITLAGQPVLTESSVVVNECLKIAQMDYSSGLTVTSGEIRTIATGADGDIGSGGDMNRMNDVNGLNSVGGIISDMSVMNSADSIHSINSNECIVGGVALGVMVSSHPMEDAEQGENATQTLLLSSSPSRNPSMSGPTDCWLLNDSANILNSPPAAAAATLQPAAVVQHSSTEHFSADISRSVLFSSALSSTSSASPTSSSSPISCADASTSPILSHSLQNPPPNDLYPSPTPLVSIVPSNNSSSHINNSINHINNNTPISLVPTSDHNLLSHSHHHCSSKSSISSVGSNTELESFSPSSCSIADDTLTSLAWLQNLNVCMTKLGAPTPPTPPASPVFFQIASITVPPPPIEYPTIPQPPPITKTVTTKASVVPTNPNTNTPKKQTKRTAKARKAAKSSIVVTAESPEQFVTVQPAIKTEQPDDNNNQLVISHNNNDTNTPIAVNCFGVTPKMENFQELHPAVPHLAPHPHLQAFYHLEMAPLHQHQLQPQQTLQLQTPVTSQPQILQAPVQATSTTTTTVKVRKTAPRPKSNSMAVSPFGPLPLLPAQDTTVSPGESTPQRPSSSGNDLLAINGPDVGVVGESECHDVDYQADGTVKPPFSYATLITMALQSTQGKMTLDSIYKWIRENFLYYRLADSSWQNSIRHNLSLNKCFIKIARTKEEPGKGGFWKLDPNCDVGSFKKRKLQGKSKSVEGDLPVDGCPKRKRMKKKNNSDLDESFVEPTTNVIYSQQSIQQQNEILAATGSISSADDSVPMGGNIYYNHSIAVTNNTFELAPYGTNSANLVGPGGNIEGIIESGNDICWNAILTDSDLNQLEVDPMSYTDSVAQIIHPIDSNGNHNGGLPITISVPEADLYYGDANMQSNTPMVHIINENAQWNEWLHASAVDVISPTGGTVSYLVDTSTPSPLTRQSNLSLSAGDVYIPVTHHSGPSSIISSIKSPPPMDVGDNHFESINSTSGHDIHPWADCKDAIENAAMQVEQCFNSIETMQHY